MKKKFNLSIILLLIIISACSVNINKNEDQNYIQASLKNQPRIIYPADAQEKAFSGMTTLILSISDTGTVVKIFLEKSSGYEVLDNAAMEYCKKLLFTPAKFNGKPIFSRLKWAIKFDISSRNRTASKYLNDIKNLYDSFLNSKGEEKEEIERAILEKHTKFITEMTDALSFNSTTKKILLPRISDEWQKEWNRWPLTFLLYHDFLLRFPDYDSPDNVKARLLKSLKEDIGYITKTHAADIGEVREKENILAKIKSFIRNNYPDLKIDDYGSDLRNIPGRITFRAGKNSRLSPQ